MEDFFTDQAKEAIDLAYKAAKDLANNYIGTEHLLIGLIQQGSGVAARVLAENGVTEEKVLNMVDQLISRTTMWPLKTNRNIRPWRQESFRTAIRRRNASRRRRSERSIF